MHLLFKSKSYLNNQEEEKINKENTFTFNQEKTIELYKTYALNM